jgi:zinc transport system substrate-binding protein
MILKSTVLMNLLKLINRLIRPGRLILVLRWLGCISASILLSACEQTPIEQPVALEPDELLSIYTVNYPLAWVAERIGGSQVRVTLPVPPGIDPAKWRPEPEAIVAYQQADLILLNGGDYAPWVMLSALPADRLIDTSVGLTDRFIRAEAGIRHRHGPAGEHSHAAVAAGFWLDPELLAAQGVVVRDALSAERPEHELQFQQNYAALLLDLRNLNVSLGEAFNLPAASYAVFARPGYQYLDQKFSLGWSVMQWEPDKLLHNHDLRQLSNAASDASLRLVIWAAEPLAENREALAEQGFVSVVFDRAGNRPASGDYVDVMQANIRHLQEAVQQ